MEQYKSFDSWLTRWAYLPDWLVGIGTPNRVPLWLFWTRATVLTPALIAFMLTVVGSVAVLFWKDPKSLLWLLGTLWFLAGVVGGFLKIVDKGKEDDDLPRDFIRFE